MKRFSILLALLLTCAMAMPVFADPGDVAMPDPSLEEYIEEIIGDDGVPGAVDGNWLIGDGGSSAGPGLNDDEGGLVALGDLDAFDFPAGVSDLTGLEAAENLEMILLGFGDISSLAPIANLPELMLLVLLNAGIGDSHMADLASGTVQPLVLLMLNLDPDVFPNTLTTAGINSIGQIGSIMEMALSDVGDNLDISGLAGLPLEWGLSLGGSGIAAGWEVISNFTDIAGLDLSETGMDNNALAAIDWSVMTELEELFLIGNELTDIAPLTALIGVADGTEIDLSENNLNKDAVCTHIPNLENAGFEVDHDSVPCGPELTIIVTGDGVTYPGAGTHRYEAGTTVNLYANQISGGGIFDRWVGNVADPNNSSTTILLNNDVTVEAVFVPGDWTLTVNHSGDGSGTTIPEPGVWAKKAGEGIYPNATPDQDSFWGGWQGDMSGIVPSPLIMDGNKVITAVFGTSGYDFTINVTGDGSTAPPANTYSLAEGTVVEVQALHTGVSDVFDHWEGDIGSADADNSTLQVVVDQERTVTAVFDVPTLTISIEGNGTTNPAAGTHTYPRGNWVNVQADADAGWQFDRWEGDFESTDPYTGFTMDSKKKITAVFVPLPTFDLELNVNGSGSVDPGAGVHSLVVGSTVDLTAQPAEGWYFDGWTGDIGTADPANAIITVLMDDDRSITANFVQYPWSLTLNVVGQGSLDLEPGVYYYNDGEHQAIHATESLEGWAFSGWSGDLDGASYDPSINLVAFPMDRDRTVTATFLEASWTLTIDLDGTGNPTPFVGTQTFGHGATVWLFADWAPGQTATTAFDRWSGDLDSTAQYVSIVMDEDKTVTAHYADADWKMTVEVSGDGPGSVFPAPGVYGFLDGRKTGITATLAPNTYWGGWDGDASGYDLLYVMTLDADKTARALFDSDGYTLTINAAPGQGSTTPAVGSHRYAAGATPVIATTPIDMGWEFVKWEGDLGLADPLLPTVTLVMDEDRAVTPTFLEGTACTDPSEGGSYPEGSDICLYVPDPVAPNSTFQWFKNGEALTADQLPGAQARALYIPDAQIFDSGSYTCEYDDGSDGKAITTYGPVFIAIRDYDAMPATGTAGLAITMLITLAAGLVYLKGRRQSLQEK